MTDTTLNPLTIPTDHCLVCGVAGDRGSGSNCPRCGATDADIRLLLRVGAKAYADARANALGGEFVRAREKLRQLCETGAVLQKKRTWLTTTKYAAVGITCAVIAFCFSIPFKYGRSSQETAKQMVQPTSDDLVSTPRPTPNTQRNGNAVSVNPTPNASPTPYPYPERLARRYYNDALSAYREKQYDNAISLADLATQTSKNTYLLPHTLLLRAQIADSTGDTNASQFWAKIATDSPTSPYAPLGLLRAAERAKKIIGRQTEVASYLQELIDRYPLSNEAGVARKRFHPVLLPGKAKEEALH